MLATTPQFSLPRCPKTRGAQPNHIIPVIRRDRVPLRCVGLGRTLGCHMPLLPVLAVPSRRGMRELKKRWSQRGCWLLQSDELRICFLGYRMGPPQICERWFVNHYIYNPHVYTSSLYHVITIFSHLFGNGSRYRLGAPSCRSLTDLHHFCMTDRYW